MELLGLNLIGNETTAAPSGATFQGVNPATSLPLQPPFHEAGEPEVDRALKGAESAFQPYRHLPAKKRAEFLNAIAAKIEANDAVLLRANEETGLPPERLKGERGRTVGQLRLFANLIDEGSWVGADRHCRPGSKARAQARPAPNAHPHRPGRDLRGKQLSAGIFSRRRRHRLGPGVRVPRRGQGPSGPPRHV